MTDCGWVEVGCAHRCGKKIPGMATNYAKWDNLDVSDDEADEQPQPRRAPAPPPPPSTPHLLLENLTQAESLGEERLQARRPRLDRAAEVEVAGDERVAVEEEADDAGVEHCACVRACARARCARWWE